MKKTYLLLSVMLMLMLPQSIFAAKFQPKLSAEIERVKAIYKEDLKLDTKEFCGVTKERTSYFDSLESHLESCERFKKRIISELQCLNNTKKTLKKNMFPRVSFSYFVDNEGMACFTESFINSNQNKYGIKSEQASEDMYKTIQNNLKMN